MGTNRLSGLYQFCGFFGGDGLSLLNRYTTVMKMVLVTEPGDVKGWDEAGSGLL